MKYRYRLWCPDCLGIDYQGCFGGGAEISEETFDTYQEAEDAGYEATNRSIWEYEVIDVYEDNH